MIKEIKLQVENSEFNFIAAKRKERKFPILFLHGFTGAAEDWLPLFDKLPETVYPIALDLPGHGKSLDLDEKFYDLENLDLIINKFLEEFSIKKILLVGYSMGGRAAYRYAVNFPEKTTGLIIESSTPGLSEKEFRETRLQSDIDLSREIMEKGIERFIDFWFSQPIFESLKNLDDRYYAQIKKIRKRNNPIELAKALRGGSQGKVRHVWDKLSKIDFPLLLIDGEMDKKYRFLNTLVLKEVPTAERVTVKKAGHNIHLEKPEEFIILVNLFIDKVLKGN